MGTAAAVISAVLGTGELVLLALALSHVIDPGWPAFETIGTIAGLGTSVGVAIVARSTRSRFPGVLDALSVAAFLAGLVGTGAWLTLFGAPFFTVDFVRAALLVAADI